ncbi:ribosome biogenesis protein SLX9-domain-containing protein, partial [Russula compacta]
QPKVRSRRSVSRAHSTSVKPVNRAFAVQDNAVQQFDIGALKDAPADEILRSVSTDVSFPQQPQHTPNKKDRRILKHELFIERLEASRAPYSKSHARRLKRKEREQLAGGLDLLKAALPSIAPTAVSAAERSAGEGRDAATAGGALPGQIGEGKGNPLTRSQRRRALKAELFRQPLVRSNPEFAANPFETIRTHARNTLVPHQPTT